MHIAWDEGPERFLRALRNEFHPKVENSFDSSETAVGSLVEDRLSRYLGRNRSAGEIAALKYEIHPEVREWVAQAWAAYILVAGPDVSVVDFVADQLAALCAENPLWFTECGE